MEAMKEDLIEDMPVEETKGKRTRAKRTTKEPTLKDTGIVGKRVLEMATTSVQLGTAKMVPPMTKEEAQGIVEPLGRIGTRYLNKFVKVKAGPNTQDILEIVVTFLFYMMKVVLTSMQLRAIEQEKKLQQLHQERYKTQPLSTAENVPEEKPVVVTASQNGHNAVLSLASSYGVRDMGTEL